MAATLRADVLFGFLIIYLVFYVKKPSFLVPDGVSITIGKEDLYNVESSICSSLWVTKRERNYKYSNNSIIYLLLLLCGDIATCPGSTQTYTGLQDFLRTKGFFVLHQNIRGMEGKKDLVADFLFNNKVNIFSFSKTFLSHKNFTDVEIGGYGFQYKKHKQIGRGVGAYIREGILYTRRKDFNRDNLEMMWLEISLNNAKKFLIAVLYQPPNSSKHQCKNFVEMLSNKLETVQNENKETIIIGDINCDYANPESHRDVKSCLSMNGFKQLIKKPTRVTENTSTIIDVLLTNSPKNAIRTEVITTNFSNYKMIGAIRKKCEHKY